MDEQYDPDDLNDILAFYSTILEKIVDRGQISLMENERMKDFQITTDNIKTNELNEDNASIQEIKMLKEKIFVHLKGKKEFEYVYDYFCNNGMGYTVDYDNFKNNFENENETPQNNRSLNKNEEFKLIVHSLNNVQSANKHTLCDLLPLSSKDFLKNKIKLDDEEIKNLKGNEINQEEIEKISKEKVIESNSNDELLLSQSSKSKNFLDDIKINKINKSSSLFLNSDVGNKSRTSTNKNIEKIEKEIEEEIDNEIFSYTKNMKSYARSFNEILVYDNTKLGKIEKNQDSSQTKTDRSMKSLNEFNYSIKIGFFKLLLMFLVVATSFIITLISIRILPRLVN